MQIRTEIDPDAPYAIMIYGYPGVGKTVLAAQARNPFIMMLDRFGDESLNNHPEIAHVPRGIPSSFDDLEKYVSGNLAKASSPVGAAETLVLDSITSLRELEIKEQRDEQATPISQFNWARNNQRINDFILNLIDKTKKMGGKNLIIIGHVKEVREGSDQDSKILIRPDISDGMLPRLAKNLSGIFYLETTDNVAKGRTERTLYCRPSGKKVDYAKNRYKLPDTITNPNWGDIEQMIRDWRIQNLKEVKQDA